MRCLAINTATSVLSVALTEGDRTLQFYETTETRDQGNLLLTHVKAVLAENNLSFADIDLLAAVRGPGSFTGIRIGLAAARGIALAAKKPIIGVTSFDMFAARKPDFINVVAVESWREELYFAVLDEEGHPLIECSNETPESFVARYAPLNARHTIVSGDAAEKVLPLLNNAILEKRSFNAISAAHIAVERFKANPKPAKPTPYYLRNADVTISTKPSKSLA